MTEQISALADDEIDLEDAEHLMASIQPNSHAAEAWSRYHLIGDVMRGSDILSANFKQNLMARIDLEPTVLSPNAAWVNESKETQLSASQVTNIKNKLPLSWSIAASFAAVMVVGWMVLQTQVPSPVQPVMIAQATAPQETPLLTAVNEPAIPDEYLMAHQASAPSASSYYIQSASYTE
jgi:sigma-E factor negative regulatory protein RseA